MKKLFLPFLATLSFLAVACQPEKVVYYTAAEADFEVSAQTVERGDLVKFTDLSKPCPGTEIVSWDWNFDFENKENTTEHSKEQNPSYAFKNVGSFVVRLVVTDNNGRTASASKSVTVVIPERELAHASFTMSAEKTMLNTAIKFTDTSVPAEGSTIKSWSWDFGESDESVSSDQNPEWTYSTSGSYTIKLTIEDTKGNISTASKDLLVMDPSDLISIEWKSKMLGAIENTVSPAMSPDGKTAYMWADQSADNAYDVVLKAFDMENGSEKWAFNVNKTFADLNTGAGVRLVYSSPAVGPNGDIYVCARDLKNASPARKSFMIAVKPEGTIHWTYAFGIDANFNYVTPAIDANGRIYIGHLSNKPFEVAVLNPETGVKEKAYSLTVGVRSGLSLDKNGNVYFCSTGTNGMYSYNSEGTSKWQYNTNFKTTGGEISIAADGTVYTVAAGSASGLLSAVTPSGASKWEYALPGDTPYGGAAIGADGTIYANGGTSTPGKETAGIVAVNPDGTLKWHFPTNEDVANCVPMVDNRGYVHFITDKGTYYVVTDDGKLYGRKSLGDQSFSSPVMNAEGKVVVAAQESGISYVYCLGTGAEGIADSAWPMKGQNYQRTHLQK